MPDGQPIPTESIAAPTEVQPTPFTQPSETPPYEEPAAMLDVHPAHHAASTWRDFFIHIATIVLGLCIAVGLEQTVEYFHRAHERRQLQDDLRAEAQRRIPQLTGLLQQFAITEDWNRETLRRGRAATASGGFITFVLPEREQKKSTLRPEDATWAAAKASGLVAVLPNREIEGWDRVDFQARRADQLNDDLGKAGGDFRAVADRLDISIDPGDTVRVTPPERDELMRALSVQYEKMRQFMRQEAFWQVDSDAAAHGAFSPDQMQPYLDRAVAVIPK